MKFEDWSNFGMDNESPCRDMYEDWEAERKQLQKEVEDYKSWRTSACRYADKLEVLIRELGHLAIGWILSSQQARGSFLGPRDKVDYETPQIRVYTILAEIDAKGEGE